MAEMKSTPGDVGKVEKVEREEKVEKKDGSDRGVTNVRETLRKLDSAPSNPHQVDPNKCARQVPVDLVEEESMESFPASDPPGHLQSNTNRPEPRRPGQVD